MDVFVVQIDKWWRHGRGPGDEPFTSARGAGAAGVTALAAVLRN